MKTKFLLPVLAMIFAVGMSFTTINHTNDPQQDFILEDGVLQPIGMELNCGDGNQTCQVQFEPNGQVYDVYDAINSSTPKVGSGQLIRP